MTNLLRIDSIEIEKESNDYPIFELIREWDQLIPDINELRLKLKLYEEVEMEIDYKSSFEILNEEYHNLQTKKLRLFNDLDCMPSFNLELKRIDLLSSIISEKLKAENKTCDARTSTG